MGKLLENNYHCHTYRCGHAEGEDEDYVLEAIKGGYKHLGFSDHIFFPCFEQPRMRGSYSLLNNYVSSIKGLAKKYQKDITLHLGFEAEYSPLFDNYYHELLDKGIVQYLILGEHGYFPYKGDFRFFSNMADPYLALHLYVDNLLLGMRTGLFKYVAHPDLYMIWFGEWNEETEWAAKTIISEAIKLNLPLEINMGPSRWGRRRLINGKEEFYYPFSSFWDIASKLGATCIYGVDAHLPNELNDTPFDLFEKFTLVHNLKPIKSLDIPPLIN